MSDSGEYVESLHELADARAEGASLRQSVLVLNTSLRHLALQFLVFATVLFLLLAILIALATSESFFLGEWRPWIPALCVVLGFGALAFLAQYMRVQQLRAGTAVVLHEIEHSISESLVVVDQR